MSKSKEAPVAEEIQLVTVKVVETIKGQPRVHQNARVTLQPVFDKERGGTVLKTGITRSDWEAHYKERFGDYNVFYEGAKDPQTHQVSEPFKVVLTGKERSFDISDPYNRIIVSLLKNHPWVAASEDEIVQNSLFVIYDEVEHAKKENIEFEYELKAGKYLFEMTQVEKGEFLKLFGFKHTENVSPEIIMKRLKDKMKADPKLFVEMWEDKARDLKIMITDLVTNQIVRRVGGVYYFGKAADGIPLGSSVEQAVEFLKNPKHNDLLLQFQRMLSEAKKNK